MVLSLDTFLETFGWGGGASCVNWLDVGSSLRKLPCQPGGGGHLAARLQEGLLRHLAQADASLTNLTVKFVKIVQTLD